MRNKVLFDDIKPQSSQVCIAINTLLSDYPAIVPCSRTKVRYIGNPSILNYPVGFFYGASAGGVCGVGSIMYIGRFDYLQIKMGCGRGINTCA